MFQTIFILSIWAISQIPLRGLAQEPECPTDKVGRASLTNSIAKSAPSNDIRHALTHFTRDSNAAAYGLSFPVKTEAGTKRIQFIIPKLTGPFQSDRTEEALASFQRHLGKETVGLGFIYGWFGDEPGRPPYHAYSRIGDTMYHLDDNANVVVESFSERQRAIAASRKGMVTYEALHALPEVERDALKDFYLKVKNGEAIVDGEKPGLEYSVLGWGKFESGKPLSISCVSYSLLFTNPVWHKEYPLLKSITDKTGMGKATDAEGQISIASVPQSIPGSTAPAVLVWGNNFSKLPLGDPAVGYLTNLRLVRVRKGVDVPPDFMDKNQLVKDPGLHVESPSPD